MARIVGRLAFALTAVPLTALPASAATPVCGASSSCSAADHTVSLVNQCDFPVWIANAANVVGGNVVGGKACTATSDCCTTLPSGTVDCTGVNCANGFCSQINCTTDSGCPGSSSGLTSCNVPVGVGCGGDADCATYSCQQSGDCPPGASCTSGTCTGMCQNKVCSCRASGPGCPGAGTVCDAPKGATFGTCGGGACQYDGLVPTGAQWKLAASCASNAQCAAGQTCSGGQCTCATTADCAEAGGSCAGGLCTGQSATICMPTGWGGRYWARTGCTLSGGSLACQTGQCGQGATAALECTDLAAGVAQTATGVTLFEGTWDSGGTDFWDVSLVNGYNVGMAVDACGTTGGVASCTFAGMASTATGVGCGATDLNASCPPLLAIGGAPSCVTAADCPKGATCGTNNLCSSGSETVTCLDPGDYCKGFGLFGNQDPLVAPACLQCNSVVDAATNPNATYNDYYNCVGDLATLSCNNAALVCFSDVDCPYAGQTCQNQVCQPINALNDLALCSGGACNTKVNMVANYGCQTVGTQSLCLPNLPSTTNEGCCGPSNPLWQTAAQAAAGSVDASGRCVAGVDDYASAFKAACPTAYSYQFDDPSSSFQCSSRSSPVNYRITFCPTAASPGRR